MINRINITQLSLLFVLGMFFTLSCKEKSEPAEAKTAPVEEIAESQSLQYEEIAAFMGLTISDDTDINKLLVFKALYPNDSLVNSDAEQNLKFYKGIVKNGKARALPVFESRQTGQSLVLFTKRAYVGSIWAEVLIQKDPRKILKVRFGHQMESEGYGAAITEADFEDQFIDREIIFDGNSFSLNQDNNILIEGESAIDGISGATSTSTTVIEMMNGGFINLSPYFKQ